MVTLWTNSYRDNPVFEAVKGGGYQLIEHTDSFSYSKRAYVKGDILKRVCELFPQSLQELKGLNRRAADFNVDKGFKGSVNASEAETKMTAWHNGERKQNVRACSDAKLKAYYKICRELGYEDEANALKAEADNRGILLESRRKNEAWNYVSGRVPNEVNGRVGGRWSSARNSRWYEKEVEIEFNNEYYLVYLSVNAELSYSNDESTNWESYEVDIDEDSISLIDIQREDPKHKYVTDPEERDVLFELAKEKLIDEKDEVFEEDWVDDRDY